MSQGTRTLKMSPETAELPPIDWNLCIKLANHKIVVAQEILALVIQQLPGDFKAIKQAQEKADHAELLRCIHRLHGALCYSGMPRLKNVVANFESHLKQNPSDKKKRAELSKQLEFEVEAVLSSQSSY